MTTCDFSKLPMVTIGKTPELTKRIEFRGSNLADSFCFGQNDVPESFKDTDTAMTWINDNMQLMLDAIKQAWYPSVSIAQRKIDNDVNAAPCYHDNVRKYNQWIEQVFSLTS